MKRVYFIRHGESEGNIGLFRQSSDAPLTEIGKEQAQIVAKRLSNINFDILITSPFKRTLQTSEFISRETGKNFIQSDLFVERKRPTEQLGKSKDSKENIESERNYLEAFRKGDKYKDGESFGEILKRANDALSFLSSLKEENIIVVTHGMFMRVICACILLKESINPESCFGFMKNLKTTNTGITIIQKDDKKDWSLITWNDQSHFADL